MTARRLVLASALAWTLFTGALALAQHRGLRTQMHDLGNADQAIWDASRGHPYMIQTNTDVGRPRSRLGVHLNPIFYALALPYRVFPRAELLILFAVLSCTAAGLGIFAFARLKLGDSLVAALPPLAFFLSPMTQDAALYDFHVVTLAAALLVWCVVAFEERRTRLAWLLLALALLCNEDIALVGVMLGAFLWRSGRRREGAIAAAASAAWFLLGAVLLVPLVNQGRGLEKLLGHGNRYAWLGEGARGIVLGALAHPLRVARHLAAWRSLRIILYLLLSGAAAGFGAWPLLLPALPQVLQGCLSDLPFNTRVTGTYYWIIAECFIVLACTAAGRRSLYALAGATAVFTLLFSPLPYGLGSGWANYAAEPGEAALVPAAREIPPLASLCAQNNLGAHFSQRPAIHVPPVQCLSAQYAILHLRDVGGPDSGLFVRADPQVLMGAAEGTPPLPMAFAVARFLLLAPEWNLLAQGDGVYLFSRDAPRQVSLDAGVRAYHEDVARFTAVAQENARSRWAVARWLNE